MAAPEHDPLVLELMREVRELRAIIADNAKQPATRIRTGADGRKITGWRWVRGTHSGTCVRDPLGTDRPEWWT
jgi:hypothetical protein